MKLRFNRTEMAEALRAICAVAATRTTKPVLRCVRLEAKGDVLLLSATDLEVALRFAVTQVEVGKAGETLVVADTLSRIVSECADEVLAMDTDDSQLHIRGEGSHFQILTQDAADFPPVPAMEGGPEFTIEQGLLRRLIEWTIFASARESTRYAINGVLWEVNAPKLTLAATDGRRLSLARGAITMGKGKTPPAVIVPNKAMSLFARLPGEDDTPVGVKATSNQLLISVGGGLISTSLVEGHFPKYQDVIPTDCDQIMQVNTEALHSAIKRASLLVNEESKGVRFSLVQDGLTLSSRAPEQGEATVAIPVKYRGDPLDIGFNPIFLLDVLRVAQTDEITMAFKEPNRPGVVRTGEDFVYVVMPVNLAAGPSAAR